MWCLIASVGDFFSGQANCDLAGPATRQADAKSGSRGDKTGGRDVCRQKESCKCRDDTTHSVPTAPLDITVPDRQCRFIEAFSSNNGGNGQRDDV